MSATATETPPGRLLPLTPTLGLALLLLLLQPGVRAAADASAPTMLSYGFSECVDNTRTLYYYSDVEATCASGADASKVVAKRTSSYVKAVARLSAYMCVLM